MKFNPSDKANSIIADIDFLLFGDSSTMNTSYSITDRTRNINIAWDEAVSILFRADPTYEWDDTSNTDLPIATLDLTAGQDHYTLPDSALIIHRFRVKDQSGSWKTLEPVLRSELTDDQLDGVGTPNAYYKIGGVIYPVSVPDYGATAGIELQFQRGANHFSITDTDSEPGFNSQFHQFLSVSASMRYALSNGMKEKLILLSQQKQQIADAMRVHYERRSPDDRPRLSLTKPNTVQYGL